MQGNTLLKAVAALLVCLGLVPNQTLGSIFEDVKQELHQHVKGMEKGILDHIESMKDGQCHAGLDTEVCMEAAQLITSKGYPCEEYTAQTKDGFLLGVQRIPHGIGQSVGDRKRPVAFLQHGLLCSSTNWISNLANESLAFILADAGYDVWLGNMRGNTYSRKHVTLDPSDQEFWHWSWDEMAEYDLPAMVDLALEKSGQKQLYYVGHSQGTMIAFAKTSKDPDFAAKIRLFMALGPVSTLGHLQNPVLKFLSEYKDEMKEFFKFFGLGEFLPTDKIMQFLTSKFCFAPTKVVCANFLFLVCGYDQKHLNETRLPVYLAHTPAGTSVQNMLHYAQMVKSGRFEMYDYGEPGNREHYGQDTPPLYAAENVTVPVYIMSAENDILADPIDVDYLALKLPNLVGNYRIPEWNHLDFIWGMAAPEVCYNRLIKLIPKFPIT